MEKKMTLAEVINSEPIIICPEIYDCLSAKAVEMCGFKACLLSSAEFACSRLGSPDLGFHTIDDLVHATYHISRTTPLPLVIDADDCFGGPLKVYNACQRIVDAGAAGILITDSVDGMVIPKDVAVSKFKAAKAAMESSDCLLIARCDVDPTKDLDEAIERCNRYVDAGADLTLIVHISKEEHHKKMALCEKIAARVQGWKMYPDLGAHDGKADVNVDDIAKLGFRFVGIHYLMYAAFEGMLDYGHHIYRDRSNVYYNTHNEPGYKFNAPAQFFGLEDDKWPNIEAKFVDDPEKRVSPHIKDFLINTVAGLK